MPTASNEATGSADTPLRQCPTPSGDYRPLIAQQIGVDLCLVRQREFYHKCHRCAYRGKPAGHRLSEPQQPAASGSGPSLG